MSDIETSEPFYTEKREMECQTENMEAYFNNNVTEDQQDDLYGLITFPPGTFDGVGGNSGEHNINSKKGDFTISSKTLLRATKVITPRKFMDHTSQTFATSIHTDLQKDKDRPSSENHCIITSSYTKKDLIPRTPFLAINRETLALPESSNMMTSTERYSQSVKCRKVDGLANICIADMNQANHLNNQDFSKISSVVPVIQESQDKQVHQASDTNGHIKKSPNVDELTMNTPPVNTMQELPGDVINTILNSIPNSSQTQCPIKIVNLNIIKDNLVGRSGFDENLEVTKSPIKLIVMDSAKELKLDFSKIPLPLQSEVISSVESGKRNDIDVKLTEIPDSHNEAKTPGELKKDYQTVVAESCPLNPNEYHEMLKVANRIRRTQNELANVEQIKKRYKCDVCPASFTKSCNLSAHKRTHTNDKRFQCDVCKKRFYVGTKLRAHMRIHTDSRPFTCEICHKSFRELGVLKNHLLTHSDNKPFECTVCQKRFNRKSKLDIHVKTHSSDKIYKCEFCTKAFSLIHYYRRHVKSHAPTKEFVCQTCNKGFHLKESYKFHLLTHDETKKKRCDLCLKTFIKEIQLRQHKCSGTPVQSTIFNCEKCGETYTTMSRLRLHMKEHEGGKVFKCDLCDKGFLQMCILKRHMVVHTVRKPFKCKLCNNEFGWLSSVRAHIVRAHHKGVVGDQFIDTTSTSTGHQAVFNCPICKEDIVEADIDSHELVHRDTPTTQKIDPVISIDKTSQNHHVSFPVDAVEPEVTSALQPLTSSKDKTSGVPVMIQVENQVFATHTPDGAEDKFQCEICRRVVEMSEKAEHDRLHIQYPYTCSFCYMNFESEVFLVNHIQIHNGDKPHRCNKCGENFANLHQLAVHRQDHELEEKKPHKCVECGRRFRQKSDLNQHMRTHTGEKPFKCDECPEKFARNDYLKRHRLRCHRKEEMLKCQHCPRKCHDSYQLNRHIKYSHMPKPFSCTMCNKKFVHQYELTTHTKSHNETKPFICKCCSKGFQKRKLLNKHLKKEHPDIESRKDLVSKYISYKESSDIGDTDVDLNFFLLPGDNQLSSNGQSDTLQFELESHKQNVEASIVEVPKDTCKDTDNVTCNT